MFTKLLVLCVVVAACARRYPRDANPHPSALDGNDGTLKQFRQRGSASDGGKCPTGLTMIKGSDKCVDIRSMDRQKRDTDQKSSLWQNLCTQSNPTYAEKVQREAIYTLSEAEEYKDEFAQKLFTTSTFNELSNSFSGIDFLRATPWFREEILPIEKVLRQKLSDNAMSELMTKIDEVLPSMYKGLKMVVAGLQVLTESLFKSNISTDANLAEKLKRTMEQVQTVLCVFHDLMVARNLQIEPLLDSEFPELNNGDLWTQAFAIYRDTLTYLDYLKQVFKTMADTDLSAAS